MRVIIMNQYVTGTVIKELREKKKLTQADLAETLLVSDKTISKWETGRGYPDITLLEPLSKTLGVSVTELLAGEAVTNANTSANMMRSRFYVCPICGNIIHSLGEASIHCHGILLTPEEAAPADGKHLLSVETDGDEYFVTTEHEMTKAHYISFVAAVSADRIQLVKLYPEWNAEVRFKRSGVQKIYLYCNRDGLFCFNCDRKK